MYTENLPVDCLYMNLLLHTFKGVWLLGIWIVVMHKRWVWVYRIHMIIDENNISALNWLWTYYSYNEGDMLAISYFYQSSFLNLDLNWQKWFPQCCVVDTCRY